MLWGGEPDLGRLSESLIFVSYPHPGRAVLVGRVLSAGLSALVPLLTYALGKEAFNIRVGSIVPLVRSGCASACYTCPSGPD